MQVTLYFLTVFNYHITFLFKIEFSLYLIKMNHLNIYLGNNEEDIVVIST